MNESTIRNLRSDPAAFRRALTISTDRGPRRFDSCIDPWQAADFRALDDTWRRVAGQDVDGPVKMRAWLERCRGASKTQDAGIMATFAMFAASSPITGVCAAGSRDQAALLLAAIRRTVGDNGWLQRFLEVQANKVVNKHTGATLDVISSEWGTSYGITPSFIIADEVCHWSTAAGEQLWFSLASSAAKRADCALVVITNSGLGMGTSWQWFARERFRESPTAYFSRLEPGKVSWITPDRLEEQRSLLPAGVFRRLWLNEWVSTAGDFLEEAAIISAMTEHGPMEGHDSNWTFAGGLDVGYRSDRTGFVILARHKGTRKIRVAYLRSWEPIGGRDVDLTDVAHVVECEAKRFKIRTLAFDPAEFMLGSQMLAKSGVRVREVRFTGQNTGDMATLLLQAFRNRDLTYWNDSRLMNDLRKLTIVQTASGFRLSAGKRDSTGHADLGVGLALALLALRDLRDGGSFDVLAWVDGKRFSSAPTEGERQSQDAELRKRQILPIRLIGSFVSSFGRSFVGTDEEQQTPGRAKLVQDPDLPGPVRFVDTSRPANRQRQLPPARTAAELLQQATTIERIHDLENRQ